MGAFSDGHRFRGEVAERRFSAFLRPFRDAGEAQVALVAAGALWEAPRG